MPLLDRSQLHLLAENCSRRTKYKNYVDELQRKKNWSKSRVRTKVEHPFCVLKRIFGFDKVKYRGLEKNHQPLLLLRTDTALPYPCHPKPLASSLVIQDSPYIYSSPTGLHRSKTSHLTS